MSLHVFRGEREAEGSLNHGNNNGSFLFYFISAESRKVVDAEQHLARSWRAFSLIESVDCGIRRDPAVITPRVAEGND